ncbi:conserved hypothetical protein [Bacteroides sp. 1_1_14]|nr:conserved hypothetical protein [Bacteroides sp. 1_1_14]
MNKRGMVSFLLQENIDELQHLADHLLHIGDKNGYVYADDLSALQQSIHEKINDLYSQRGKTPEQDATLCLAILQGYNVSMYANPEDEDRKRSVLQRSLTLLDALPPSLLKQQLSAVCHGMQELCETNLTFLFVNENTTTF